MRNADWGPRNAECRMSEGNRGRVGRGKQDGLGLLYGCVRLTNVQGLLLIQGEANR